MRTLAIGQIRKLNATEIRDLLPVMMTYENEPFAMLCNPEDIVVIADMHPTVRRQFRAKEAQVRAGMPKDMKLEATNMREVPVMLIDD